MRALRSWHGLLGTLVLALPAPAGAQAVGSEFQVNTYTTGNQQTRAFGARSVAGDAKGNFVVVWNSFGQDGSYDGIFGQRYDSGGGALGSEFRVNSYTADFQKYPAVAAAADGAFVVVWTSLFQDGDSYGIFAQRYNSEGVALGAEFRVNSYTTSSQDLPSVASDASGNFVVVWKSFQDGYYYGVFGQRYDSEGVAQGDEFRVDSYTTAFYRFPSVASDPRGNFVVVWGSGDQQGSGYEIFGRRYDSKGVAQGDEFRVNSYTTADQNLPSVAADASGDFVVVWTSDDQDGDRSGIFGQRYDSKGVAQGAEFQVNSFTTAYQWFPSVAADGAGNFVVAWHGYGQHGHEIVGQRYDSKGVAQGAEFQINSFTTGYQASSHVAVAGTNQFVVAWSSDDQDGSDAGVFGQRFSFPAVRVESPDTNVKWRIGSVQQILWTHNLGLGATVQIELDRDDDGNYEELIAAAALADNPTRGHVAWTVTGPLSPAARVRISWTDDLSVSDASDVTFQVRPAEFDGER